MEPPKNIRSAAKVVNVFGYWPSFHDAVVVKYEGPTVERPTVEVTLHTWEMTSEVDAKGYFVLQKHVLISIRFFDVFDVQMEHFGTDNILFGMYITDDTQHSSMTGWFSGQYCMLSFFIKTVGIEEYSSCTYFFDQSG